MPKYQIYLEASRSHPAERQELQALSASAVFSWAERCAHGRRFEVLVDGASLGIAALSQGGNFWILSPASGRLPMGEQAEESFVPATLSE